MRRVKIVDEFPETHFYIDIDAIVTATLCYNEDGTRTLWLRTSFNTEDCIQIVNDTVANKLLKILDESSEEI